jgi:hypothetical protein
MITLFIGHRFTRRNGTNQSLFKIINKFAYIGKPVFRDLCDRLWTAVSPRPACISCIIERKRFVLPRKNFLFSLSRFVFVYWELGHFWSCDYLFLFCNRGFRLLPWRTGVCLFGHYSFVSFVFSR